MTALSLQARLAQTRSFSPRLQHAARLQQMSTLDYAQALQDAALVNPFHDVETPGQSVDSVDLPDAPQAPVMRNPNGRTASTARAQASRRRRIDCRMTKASTCCSRRPCP